MTQLHFDMQLVEFAPQWLVERLRYEFTDILIKIAKTLWGIWFFRNKVVWEDKVNSQVAMDWSNRVITDWLRARLYKKCSPVIINRGVQLDTVKWKNLKLGTFKVNVDAAVPIGGDTYSIGMVLRDHWGSFLEAKVMGFSGKVSVVEAEAVGIREALS